MAHPITVSIGTGNKVSASYQSQEVHLTVTYELERTDFDLDTFVAQKAEEIERLHSTAWGNIRDIRQAKHAEQQASVKSETNGAPPEATPQTTEVAQPEPGAPVAESYDPGEQAEELAQAHTADGDVEPDPFADDAKPVLENQTLRLTAVNGNGAMPVGTATDRTQKAKLTSGEPEARATDPQLRAIKMLMSRSGHTLESLTVLLQERYECDSFEELTKSEASELLLEFQRAVAVAA